MTQPTGYPSPLRTGLANNPNINVADKPVYKEINDIYNALRIVQDQLQLNCPVQSAFFTEAVSYGDLINLYNVAGILSARKATATSAAKLAHGFCYAKGGVKINTQGELLLQGVWLTATGLTPGATYFLSNTAGLAAAAAGTTSQKIGIALSTTQLFIRPDHP